MKRVFVATTVLFLHTAAPTAAAWAQQGPDAPFGPFPSGPGATPPSSPQPATPGHAAPGPAPAAPPSAVAPSPPPAAPGAGAEPAPAADDGYPPGYGPPPGYVPPPSYAPPRTYYGPPGGNQGGYGGGYGGPPTYGQPPGYYHYHHLLQPLAPRRVTDRPFTIGGGIGFGGLALNDASGTWKHNGLSYTARLGIGLRPGLLLLWDIEGSSVDRSIVEGAVARVHSFSQTAQLVALQVFVGDRFFLKGGFGAAQFSRDDGFFTDWGSAVMGGVGLELVQGWNWSLDVESSVTAASYQNETLYNWSIANLAINLF